MSTKAPKGINKQKGYVVLEVDGKRYPLLFDSTAIADVEEILGRSIFQIIGNLERVGFSELRALIFCGLPLKWRAKHGFRSHRDVGSLISFGNVFQVAQVVFEAVSLALPKDMKIGIEADDEFADDEFDDLDDLDTRNFDDIASGVPEGDGPLDGALPEPAPPETEDPTS